MRRLVAVAVAELARFWCPPRSATQFTVDHLAWVSDVRLLRNKLT
jgi:hypothetical protein